MAVTGRVRRGTSIAAVGLLAATLTMIASAAGAAQPVTEHPIRASRNAPSASEAPQWKRGLIRRDTEGRVALDTSPKAIRLGRQQLGSHALAALPARSCRTAGAGGRLKRRPPKRIKDLVEKLAPKYGIDARLVLAVMAVESGFQVKAVSDKNAQGLMQLIPRTARRFGVKDPFDPAQNINGGIRYLRWLVDRFRGDLALVLAGYNAGEQAVEKYGGVPPFRETRLYVKKVHALYACNRLRNSPRLTAADLFGGLSGSVMDQRNIWPPVRQPYDLWNAASASVERAASDDCRAFGVGVGIGTAPAIWPHASPSAGWQPGRRCR